MFFSFFSFRLLLFLSGHLGDLVKLSFYFTLFILFYFLHVLNLDMMAVDDFIDVDVALNIFLKSSCGFFLSHSLVWENWMLIYSAFNKLLPRHRILCRFSLLCFVEDDNDDFLLFFSVHRRLEMWRNSSLQPNERMKNFLRG